jgi:hypothetical protein
VLTCGHGHIGNTALAACRWLCLEPAALLNPRRPCVHPHCLIQPVHCSSCTLPFAMFMGVYSISVQLGVDDVSICTAVDCSSCVPLFRWLCRAPVTSQRQQGQVCCRTRVTALPRSQRVASHGCCSSLATRSCLVTQLGSEREPSKPELNTYHSTVLESVQADIRNPVV